MDYVEIGSAPADEECAQVGEQDYETKARAQCDAFIKLIIRHLGEPPHGARLRTKGFEHDFGTYYVVVAFYQDGDEAAFDYAFRCEAEAPTTWEG